MKNDERWSQIAKALFDSYVLSDVIGAYQIIDNQIDLKFIKKLSVKVNCKIGLLRKIIFISYLRINYEKPTLFVTEQQENSTMSQVIKHLIKRTDISLYEFENRFNCLRLELNRQNPSLSLTTKELMDFIHPLYLEAIEETFKK